MMDPSYGSINLFLALSPPKLKTKASSRRRRTWPLELHKRGIQIGKQRTTLLHRSTVMDIGDSVLVGVVVRCNKPEPDGIIPFSRLKSFDDGLLFFFVLAQQPP